MAQGPPRKQDVTYSLLAIKETSNGKELEKGGTCIDEENQETWSPLVREVPTEDKKLVLETRRDSKTTVDWVNGHCQTADRRESAITSVPRIS